MRVKKLITKLSIVFFLSAFFGNGAFADESPKNRIRQCTPRAGDNSTTTPHPEGLDFNPTGYGDDFEYEVDNPICAAVVLPPYAAVKVAIAAMNGICGSGSVIPRVTPSPILDTRDIVKATKNATNAACRVAVATSIASMSSMIASVGFQYLNAKDAYENTHLCGSGANGGNDEWTGWNSLDMSRNIPKKQDGVTKTVQQWIQNCQSDSSSNDCNLLRSGLINSDYRQWYYNGVEKEDTSDDACPDVTRHLGDWDGDTNKVNYKGQNYPAQRYYMRGTEAGNYACDRYNARLVRNDPFTGQPLSESRVDDFNFAHQCCIKRSKTTVCIEREYCNHDVYMSDCSSSDTTIEHKFCTGGGRCSLGHASHVAEFNAGYRDDNRLICVSSYNMCPYNFNVGGGTTECDMFKDGINNNGVFTPVSPENIAAQNCKGKSEIRNDDCTINSKAGKCKNYCQYLNHCVVVGGNDYIYDTSITSPYFASACVDFTGDSKNGYGYNTGLFAGTQKHFTAPMAQCVKETLENVFYNKAGHTECGNMNERPDKNGKCFTDLYKYKKGEKVAGFQSFFSYLQDKIKDAIKAALTVAVVIFGIKILLGGQVPKAPELIMTTVKLSLVVYFVLGTAWQEKFFDGVYNVAPFFSTVVMNIKTGGTEMQRDGCQFGKITMPNGTSQIVSEYPSGKEYLAVWDTLDCKVARYLGFGPSFTVANIAKLVLAGFFTGMIGVYFAILTLLFGIYMIIAALKALHIFLASAFTIIMMVYISPITITCSLFKRTENIFKAWLVNLISFTMQPVILFAYIGLFITVFDTAMIGSATFSGNPPEKTIVCDKICVDRNGNMVANLANDSATTCDIENGDKIIDPMSDSVACMINLSNSKFGKIPVLEPLGIALPLLKDVFTDNGREKILTMTKALFVIYILVAFMGQIPDIASSIMAGTSLSGAEANVLPIKLDAKNMRNKLQGVVGGIQKRGMGLARKGGGAAKSAAGNAKEVVRAGGSGSAPKDNNSGSASGNDAGQAEDQP